MTVFTNWPDSCDAESELAERGQWGISVPIMAKIDNAFCKLLLPKEMNKCRRQGKPSFCMKALHIWTSAIIRKGFFSPFSLPFLGGDGKWERAGCEKGKTYFSRSVNWRQRFCGLSKQIALAQGKEGIKIILEVLVLSGCLYIPVTHSDSIFPERAVPLSSSGTTILILPHVLLPWVGTPQNSKNRFFPIVGVIWILYQGIWKVIRNQAEQPAMPLLLQGLVGKSHCLSSKQGIMRSMRGHSLCESLFLKTWADMIQNGCNTHWVRVSIPGTPPYHWFHVRPLASPAAPPCLSSPINKWVYDGTFWVTSSLVQAAIAGCWSVMDRSSSAQQIDSLL